MSRRGRGVPNGLDVAEGCRDGIDEEGGRTRAWGDQLLPVFWSQDDITPWPGETATLTAAYDATQLEGQSSVFSVGGWNTPTVDLAAG